MVIARKNALLHEGRERRHSQPAHAARGLAATRSEGVVSNLDPQWNQAGRVGRGADQVLKSPKSHWSDGRFACDELCSIKCRCYRPRGRNLNVVSGLATA